MAIRLQTEYFGIGIEKVNIEFLIMKLCVKHFQLKYSQLKYSTMLNLILIASFFQLNSSAVQPAFLFQRHLSLIYLHTTIRTITYSIIYVGQVVLLIVLFKKKENKKEKKKKQTKLLVMLKNGNAETYLCKLYGWMGNILAGLYVKM